jgi:tripartite-type tricarboxylate transporter receptor subunit TctC
MYVLDQLERSPTALLTSRRACPKWGLCLKYDPLRDFVPVVSLSRANMFLVVNPFFPAKTVSDLVAMAKQRPGELQYVNPGSGTPPHLAALAFTQATSTVMEPISYRGSGPAIADLVSGPVPIIFLGLSASAPQVQSGKLRTLAITGPQRIAEFSDIPTFRESGVDLGGFADGAWFGIVAPTGTPAAIVEKLNGALNQVLVDPKTGSAFEKAFATPPRSSVHFSEHSRNFGARRLSQAECVQTDTQR